MNTYELPFDKSKYLEQVTSKFIIAANFFIGPRNRFKNIKQFAEYMEYAPSNMSSIIRGERNVPLEYAVILSKKLNINLYYLMGDSSDMFGNEEVMKRLQRIEKQLENHEQLLKRLSTKRP